MAELGRARAAEGAAEQELRAILAAIADGIVVVDDEGDVAFANPAAETLFGRTSEELIGTPFGFPLVAGKTTEVELLSRGGQPLVVEMRAAEITWDGRDACLASLRDITERKRAESAREELYRAQAGRDAAERALRARDEFLAVAAHELKTPLTRLRLSTQRVLRRLTRAGQAVPPEVSETFQLVDRESDHISRLVGQLLDMSRIDNGTFRLAPVVTDLRALVGGIADQARASTTLHEVLSHLPPEPLEARVDPRVVESVVSSLVANAVRYSPPGTTIEVGIEPVEGGACLSVRDHGPSAGAEYVPGLFDRGNGDTNSYFSGTGLGLYVCRRLVELHGGKIEVEHPAGGGARIVATLPLA